jgi:hypothetical protein
VPLRPLVATRRLRRETEAHAISDAIGVERVLVDTEALLRRNG